MSIHRYTKCDRDMNARKTNISIIDMIQPNFALPSIEKGNNSRSLYYHFFYIAPKVGFSSIEDSSDINHDSCFKPSKV